MSEKNVSFIDFATLKDKSAPVCGQVTNTVDWIALRVVSFDCNVLILQWPAVTTSAFSMTCVHWTLRDYR
jgi:hypothetical protein